MAPGDDSGGSTPPLATTWRGSPNWQRQSPEPRPTSNYRSQAQYSPPNVRSTGYGRMSSGCWFNSSSPSQQWAVAQSQSPAILILIRSSRADVPNGRHAEAREMANLPGLTKFRLRLT